MSLILKTLPDEQIVLITFPDGLPAVGESRGPNQALREILDAFDPNEQIFTIVDLRGLKMSLDEIAYMLARSVRSNDSWYENLTILVVGDGFKSNLVAESIQQEQYGSHPAAFFTSLEEALAYARQP